ncbi:MAG: hypothetical protein AAGJ68_09945 [Pseudomonadota bacterium]
MMRYAADPILRLGAILLACTIGLAALSFAFPYGRSIEDMPVLAYVGLALVAGAVWLCLPFQVRRASAHNRSLIFIILLGLAMRGAMFFSLPVLEDDSYRYLWDGAVTVRGLDPYAFAPGELSPAMTLGGEIQTNRGADFEALQALAAENSVAHGRINYPYVSTIYPPLAQAAFAAAHIIEPFGLTGWRLVLLAVDLITLFLLLKLLRSFDRSPTWASLYWWNPVVIVQGFGAGHMDLLVVPFLLGAILLARQQRVLSAALALVGGVAIKFWPVLLLPLILRPLLKQPVRLVFVSVVFAATTALILSPQLLHALRPEAGLNAYASDWRTHAFVFAILEDFVFSGLEDPGQVARAFVVILMIALTALLSLRFADDTSRLPSLFVVLIAAMIFLSPTGYPWYFIWLAPLLPFVPRTAVLALFALAPFYWLRFQFGDDALVYQWGVVPIAFGLPLSLVALAYFQRRSIHAIRHHHPSFE